MKSFVRFAAKWPVKCFRSVSLAGLLLTIIPQVWAQVYYKVQTSSGGILYRYDIPTNNWVTVGPLPTQKQEPPDLGSRIYTADPLYTDGVSLYTNGYVDARVGYRRLLRYDSATGWQLLADKKPLFGTGAGFCPGRN